MAGEAKEQTASMATHQTDGGTRKATGVRTAVAEASKETAQIRKIYNQLQDQARVEAARHVLTMAPTSTTPSEAKRA